MTRETLTVPQPLLDAIRDRRKTHPIKLRVLAEALMELSDMFTGQKPMRPGYMSKPSLRAAYTHYYLPVHYLKVRRVLDELATYATINGPALDYGCGPGTGALGIGKGDVDLFDIVDEAYDDADFLIRSFTKIQPRLLSTEPTGRYKLIVAANVLAEMADTRTLRGLADRNLEPDGYLVIIEPALKSTTQRLMAWRDELAAAGFTIAAPCLRQSPCPMRASPDMWCHEDVPWNRPSIVGELDQRTGLNKESIKYSYLVVTKTGATLASRNVGHRVVTDLHRGHGRCWTALCGREGALCNADMLMRHRDEMRHDFFRARRGDLLAIDPPLSGESARVGAETTVKRV